MATTKEEEIKMTENQIFQAVLELEQDKTVSPDGTARTKEIMAKTGLSEKKVVRALGKLKEAGKIIPVYSPRDTLRGIVPVLCYKPIGDSLETITDEN